jgi:hypothetical protein
MGEIRSSQVWMESGKGKYIIGYIIKRNAGFVKQGAEMDGKKGTKRPEKRAAFLEEIFWRISRKNS